MYIALDRYILMIVYKFTWRVVRRVPLITARAVLIVLLNLWLEMVYIFPACSLLLVVWHSFAVYLSRFLYVILEVLIEGWHGSRITETYTVIKMT